MPIQRHERPDNGTSFFHARADFSCRRTEATIDDPLPQIAVPKQQEYSGYAAPAVTRTSIGECIDRPNAPDSPARLQHLQQLTINGRFLTQNLTGVQRYAGEIVSALDTLLEDEKWSASLKAKIIVPSAGANKLALHTIGVQPTFGRVGGPMWTQCVLPLMSRGILLSLGNIGPILSSNHVICIHDAQHIPRAGKLQPSVSDLLPDHPAYFGQARGPPRYSFEFFGPHAGRIQTLPA